MFQTVKFLEDNFDDVDGVIGLVGKYWPVTPRREAVRKWFSRESVASEWWPVLLLVLETHTGRPVSLAPYTIRWGIDDGIFA
jgi:hypothetical protein